MGEQLASMKRTGLLIDPVHLSKGRLIIGTKWVIKQRKNLEGNVERYNARLVAKGFTQVFVLDYFGTYAPVAGLGSVCDGGIDEHYFSLMDVEAAFPNAELNEELYI